MVTNHGRTQCTQRTTHTTQRVLNELLDTGTMDPPLPVFGFMGFLVAALPSFIDSYFGDLLIHWHVMLLRRSLGASQHQQL